jgi:hypothetical protein
MGLRIETMPEVFLWYREDQDLESLVHSLVNAVCSARPYTVPGRKVAPAVEQTLLRVLQFGQGLKFERDANAGTPLSRGEQGPAVTGWGTRRCRARGSDPHPLEGRGAGADRLI